MQKFLLEFADSARDTHPSAGGVKTHVRIQDFNGADLALAGVRFDLLQDLLELVRFADMDDREVYGDTRNEEHACDQVFHEILPLGI